jgi:hypothetical protein
VKRGRACSSTTSNTVVADRACVSWDCALEQRQAVHLLEALTAQTQVITTSESSEDVFVSGLMWQ